MGRFLRSILISGLLLPVAATGQTTIIDSLSTAFRKADTNQKKLEAILILLEQHHSIHRDSLAQYVVIARQLAQKSNSLNKSLAEIAFANSNLRWGWTDSALSIIEKELPNNNAEDPVTRDIYFKLLRTKALAFGTKSDFKTALSILFQLVGEEERFKDSVSAAANMNTIASISIARNEPKEAFGWLYKAISFTGSAKKFKANQSAIYINMANAYQMIGKADSAKYFIHKGMLLSRKVENLNTLASALRVQSDVYMQESKFKEAEASLKEMFDIRKKMTGGPQMIVDDNLMLIDFYLTTRQVDKAILLCKQNLLQGNLYDSTSGKGKLFNNNINLRLPYYEALARSYKASGNTKLYQQTLEDVIAAKDSFYLTNAAGAIAELQTKYEVQKKETTIVLQKLDLVQKNNLVYGSMGLLLFVVGMAFLGFNSYRKKEKLKMQLMKEEERRMSVKAVTEAEEKERKRISADLHDNLGAYANAVLYNTELLQLEENILKRKELMNDLQYASKDIIISLRETIWALKKDMYTADDCLLRIRNFVQPFGRYYPQITFIVEGMAPPDLVLTGSKALHLVRMVQEAVNNSIKHAYAKNVTVSSSYKNGDWKIVVEDDGKGFPGQTFVAGNEQNGLANLRDRALTASIMLSIQSEPDKGTSIEMLVPTEILIQK
ncbi:MAG: ATP-binding protein [Chitinophagaceae bacterium]